MDLQPSTPNLSAYSKDDSHFKLIDIKKFSFKRRKQQRNKSKRLLSCGGQIESRGTENFSFAPMDSFLYMEAQGTKPMFSDQHGLCMTKVNQKTLSLDRTFLSV